MFMKTKKNLSRHRMLFIQFWYCTSSVKCVKFKQIANKLACLLIIMRSFLKNQLNFSLPEYSAS